IFCKRIYYSIAKILAEKEGAKAISTGEIIGEQASQTIDNLAVIQNSIGDFIVLRPLLCLDKELVIRHARDIGTYDISIMAKDPCKAAPKYPITRSLLGPYRNLESRLNIADEFYKIIENAEIFEVLPEDE
ncbi:MAG: hypothetical protein ACTSRA_17365, partial [Promethearchaeota archaeon]